MNIKVKLFSPFIFSDGNRTCNIEVEEESKLIDLIDLLDNSGLFSPYGKDSLLVIIDNNIISDDYSLQNKEKVEILLQVSGG